MEAEWENLGLLLDSISRFSEVDRLTILGSFRKVAVGKNEILVKAGDICEDFYFVNSGCLRTYFLTSAGQEKTRLILPAYSIGTALTSFIGKRR
jgi:CRP-like cAMP-binding protein